MQWKLLVSALVVGTLLAPHAAAARTVTASYELAFQNLNGQAADPAGLTSDGTIDYGGVTFNALAGERSLTVTVQDALGGAPYIVVCQDANANNICGEPGELRASGCGGGTFALSGTAGLIRVFVSVQDQVAPSVGQQSVTIQPCGAPDVATSGTVSATFS